MEKYILRYGIHKGTICSREYSIPEEFNTYEEAYNNYEKIYLFPGYVIWFAEITHPDGKVTQLESNTNYI